MKHLFRQAIKIYPNPSTDKFGKKSYSAYTEVKGRFVEGQTVYTNRKGEQHVADGKLWLPKSVTELYVQSRVDIDDKEYRVVTLEKQVDGMGKLKFYYAKVTAYVSS